MHTVPRYKPTETAEHYRDFALAYLEGAERLCGELASGAWAPSFHKGQVAPWSENRTFSPELFVGELAALRDDIARVSCAVFGQ
jgi:hypothetical protein